MMTSIVRLVYTGIYQKNSGQANVTQQGFLEEIRIELYFEMEQDKDTHRENQNIRERIYEKACKQKQALCFVQMWKMIDFVNLQQKDSL